MRRFLSKPKLHVALGRPLHDHGDGVDHGQHGGSARHGTAAQRGDSGCRFAGATCWRSKPGGASSKWFTTIVRISQILTRQAFENAIRVNAAIGGSTNFVLHMLALAGRMGVKLELDDFDRLGHALPLLVNLMPSGKFLMEDFYYAGGVPAVVRALGDLIHRDALTVNGKTMGENTADAPCWNAEVIHSREKPIKEHAGIAVLRGNLAPGGAVVKPSAASPHLLKHRGRAVVFADIEDFKKRVDDPDLDVDENSVMVLKGAGPKGYPGMPEVGNMPIPKKLLERGITDVVRVSDARMSGTAYGPLFCT